MSADLAPRPLEALQLLADGFSIAEIAELMTIGKSGVTMSIKRAKDALGGVTSAHGVAIALRRGLIA